MPMNYSLTTTTNELFSYPLVLLWYNPPGIAYRRNSVRSLIVAEWGDTNQPESAVATEDKKEVGGLTFPLPTAPRMVFNLYRLKTTESRNILIS